MPRLLSKLELNGFKSFAVKTVFEFPEGITAIVGPNGSGKSNIIDAIRWLLGERDAKSLRGGKSEDLIFGGTPGKPRVGLAQASLHFENANGFFPVDYSEVVVSRKVSRDGDNSYFINGSEVRLKDLVDFFAKARLGARGFVVITQGNSDMFIRVSPKERKEMIEEMLGLREYELKRSEAERRLKNTQINLDKVQALIDEILPHLRSLKRQTSRWEKRGILEEDLKNLENMYFGASYDEYSRSMLEIASKAAEKNISRAALEKAIVEAEKKLKNVESAEPEEREELSGIKRKTRELLDTKSNLQKDIGRLEAKMEIHAERESENMPDQKALYDLISVIDRELSSLNFENIAGARSVVEKIKEKIHAIFHGAEKAKTSVSGGEIRLEFEKIARDMEALEKELADLSSREKELEKSQDGFYAEFKRAVSDLDAAKKNMERWETEKHALEYEEERVKLRMEEWSRQVEQAGRRPEEFKNIRIEGQIPESGELDRRIFKLRGDLASMGEVDHALVKEARDTEERYEFLGHELGDLSKARDDLRALILELSEKIKSEFDEALKKINKELATFFELMFGGGHAELKVVAPKPKKQLEAEAASAAEGLGEEISVKDAAEIPEEDDVKNDEGIEITVKLPKKRINSLEMLSGGERSLVGIAALFAMISVSPPPFLVLDEVDAPLDERNARRFAELLKQFSKETQFILVTHNRATMEAANILYGATMNEDGTSKVVSLKLHEYAS